MKKLELNILTKLLSKKCPYSIPRSGEKGKQVNCYVITIYEGDTPIALIKSIESNGLIGDAFDKGRFSKEVSIPLKNTGQVMNLYF